MENREDLDPFTLQAVHDAITLEQQFSDARIISSERLRDLSSPFREAFQSFYGRDDAAGKLEGIEL
jgi:hypothetical protein